MVASACVLLGASVAASDPAPAWPEPGEPGYAALAADWREDAPTPPVEDFTPAANNSLGRTGLANAIKAQLKTVGGTKAVYVYDTDSTGKKKLFSSNANRLMILASNEKLFTTAALIGRYGAAGRLETTVYARGKWGKPNSKGKRTLDGTLVLRGGGDPALGTRGYANPRGLPLTSLNTLANQVKAAGVRRVKKGVRIDDSVFDRKRGVADTGWQAGSYLSPLSGLSFNGGVGKGGYYLKSPEMQAGKTFASLLRKRGIKVGGGKIRRTTIKKKDLRRKEPIATAGSPTVATLAAVTNKPSNNFYAEMLNKSLAIKPGSSASTKKGTNRIRAHARKKLGVTVEAFDGSGLDRRNRASAKAVGQMLARMLSRNTKADRDAFWNSLPVAGSEGTVASRMRGTPAAGNCRAKTGTLRDVSSLSGYCRVGGHTIAFSILMNNVTDFYAARLAQDRIAAAIARYRE